MRAWIGAALALCLSDPALARTNPEDRDGGALRSPQAALRTIVCTVVPWRPRSTSFARTASDRPAGPVPEAASDEDAARAVVHRLLIAFRCAEIANVEREIAPDFLFRSDDSLFLAAFPDGAMRDDEIAYLHTLLQVQGEQVPRTVGEDLSTTSVGWGPLWALRRGGLDGPIRVYVGHVPVEFAPVHAHRRDVMPGWNEFDVVRTTQGWRVTRWLETHPWLQGQDMMVATLSQLTAPRARATRGAASSDPVRDAPPTHLGLAVRGERAGNALVFDLALPRAGGALEVFDVLGRRVAQRDLAELRPGLRTVRFDAAAIAPGIYWARVRQNTDEARARVVWVR